MGPDVQPIGNNINNVFQRINKLPMAFAGCHRRNRKQKFILRGDLSLFYFEFFLQNVSKQ